MFRGFLGSFLDNMMSSHRSNIESLLDKEDTTLETLLLDSEVLTQCKWGNQRLVSYFDHDKVAEMIDFIIKMPPEGCTHDRGHKLPFIASEIFNCELSKLNDIFFTARPVETVSQSKKQTDKGNIYDRDEENEENESENYNQNNQQDDNDEDNAPNQDEDNEFDSLISKDEDNKGEESQNVLRKSFGETRGSSGFGVQKSDKARSNRYQVQEDDEVDQDEIELRSDEVLEEQQTQFPQTYDTDPYQQTQDTFENQNESQPEENKVEVIQEEQNQQNEEQLVEVKVDDIQYQTNEQIPDKIEQLNQQIDKIENQEELKQEEQQTEIVQVQQDDEVQQEEGGEENLGASITDQIQENYIEAKTEENVEENSHQELQHTIDIVENHIQSEEVVSEDEETSLSTAPTKQDIQQAPPNEFELFEKLLSFLDTDEQLNPVLAGYFCKLFQVLVGNKPKDVFNYVYTHPEVLYNMVKHINSKSISEVLIRLLNVTENVLDDAYSGQFDNIRQSFIFKVVEKLHPQYGYEDHLNAQSLLTELVEYKAIYQELTSQRSLEVFSECLSSESSSSKANTYLVLQGISQKYKSNENFSKRINFSNFQDCGDDMVLEDDEDVLVFNDDKESVFFAFIKKIIKENISKELSIPSEADQEDLYTRSYGICKEPFGIVRIRAVEFLNQIYQIFFKDIHASFADADLYNSLLFFFDHYPFHNVLHQKVTEIFSLALEKNNESVINHLLYQTSLVKKILDTSREGGIHVFMGTGQRVNRGYMAFMRKLANKIDELSKKNEEVQNFLESIPEWTEFHQNILTVINLIESKPLASDPRKKQTSSSDDYFDILYKIKDARSGFQNKSKKQQEQNEKPEEEDEEEPDMIDDKDDDNENKKKSENENENEGKTNSNSDNNAFDQNKDLYFNSDLAKNIGRYGRNNRIKNQDYQQFQKEEDDDDDDDFQRLIYKDDDDDDQNGDNKQDNGDLAQYFSNGDDQTQKPWEHEQEEDEARFEEDEDRSEEENPLSMNDLIQQSSPKFEHSQASEELKESNEDQEPKQMEAPLKIIEVELPEQEREPLDENFQAHLYWKVDIIQNESIDTLLQDYE
ncbi:UNKNOWN [Stylonychia lemnae]|uniref:Uncharacterized protein n=1 Tax=Stylonychia lemnae TaxID=5949 RepID=A0A078AX28_STYLE|nr:UNKNOWN [Stylonychia lemnae]|eukprot:CDW85807.1 UNKNOWN [Stylonychia lemnae]